MHEQFEELAVAWLCRSFEQRSPVIGEACVEIAAICDALASLAVRLDGLASQKDERRPDDEARGSRSR